MLINRVELEDLRVWFNSPGRKPLVIRGARQVGKSTLVTLFAKQQNLQLFAINLERNPEYQQAFTTNDPKKIISTLELIVGKKLSLTDGLLFIDEIQTAPKALATLRYFYEELPALRVMAAGSLLEFALADMPFSMPVGRIEYLHLGPLRFEDFLKSCGQEALAHYIGQLTFEEIQAAVLPEAVHHQLLEYLKLFWIVGGMPEAVAIYAASHDFMEVARVHHSIVDTYRDDFNKYSKTAQRNIVQLVFDQLPMHIGKKLKYTLLSRDHRSAEMSDALQLLCLAKIVSKIFHSSANGVPLGAGQNERIFKILFLDVGLVCAALKLNLFNLDNQKLTMINQGALAEQFIGQHLLYAAPAFQQPSLFYWQREAKSAAAEVDYVMSDGQQIIPVEIKAGTTGALKSMHQFLAEKNRVLGLRFNADVPSFLSDKHKLTDGRSVNYQLLSLPLYLVGQTQRLLNQSLNQSLNQLPTKNETH
jgi:hypothetical protein